MTGRRDTAGRPRTTGPVGQVRPVRLGVRSGAALTLVLLVLILNVGARLLAKLFQPKAR